jgi:tripartite-type tricarboxylate transporter receptor subunit TctC
MIKKLIVILVGMVCSAAAWSQAFPSRPITMIVPFPPGGGGDVQMRALSQIAAKHLGQPIVVVNKPGAAGSLGAVTLANSAPDGYTLSQIPVGVYRQAHMSNMPYDAANLSYVIGVSGYMFGTVVRADAPWKTLNELLDYAKANPDKLRYSTVSYGSVQHLTMERIAEERGGLKWLHVPYKGLPEAIMAVLGGHVDFESDTSGWAGHVDSGRLRLLATYGETRAKRWPSVPTLKELGINITENSPYGIAGPKGMDPAVLAKLHDAFKKALYDPEHMKVLDTLNQEVVYMTPEQYTAHARKQLEVQADIVKRFNLKPN